MRPTLDIVIVNWNAGPNLRACLQSVDDARRNELELKHVVVVDNASTDGSLADLEFPCLPLSIVRNIENRGFAAACNQGAQGNSGDYLLLLNPDVRVCIDSFQVPLEFLEDSANKEVGICGIQLLGDSGNITRSCARFPTGSSFFFQMVGLDRMFPSLFKGHFLSLEDHLKSGPVDQVMGAFFLVRRSLFEALEGFDERFFVYYEDLDFACRAKQLGWKSYYLAKVQAHHRGGGCSAQAKAQRLFYSLRSRTLYASKHFQPVAAAGVIMCTLLLEPISRLALAVAHKSGQGTRETLQAYKMLWSSLPSLLRKRRALKEKKTSTGKVGSIPV